MTAYRICGLPLDAPKPACVTNETLENDMNDELQTVATIIRDIAFRAHERACNHCKAGVYGLCRNSDACIRTMADGQALQRVADCLTLG